MQRWESVHRPPETKARGSLGVDLPQLGPVALFRACAEDSAETLDEKLWLSVQSARTPPCTKM